MYGVRSLGLAVLLIVGGSSANSNTGKCKTGINAVPLDSNTTVGKWNLVYITDTDRTRQLASDSIVITSTGDNTYKLVETRVSTNGKSSSQDYKLSLVDNVFNSEAVEGGKVNQYKVHPLVLTNDKAILFYHCSDAGTSPDDFRFVVVREDGSLSDESLKQIQDLDKSLSFNGNLFKLSGA